MSELTITRGLPASGKSDWAKTQVAQGKAHARVNRDDLRLGLFGVVGVGDAGQEIAVTKAQMAIVASMISKRGRKVIVDDTNLRIKTVREWKALAELHGAKFRVQDFAVSVDECIRRDKQRERVVGEGVIKNMSKRYMGGGSELPTLPNDVYLPAEKVVYVEDDSLPHAWIFDIDGTLAHMNGKRGPFDHNVDVDDPDIAVINLLKTLKASGKEIVLFSGREEATRENTVLWLDAFEVPHDALYMRETGSGEKDSLMKSRFFDDCIVGKFFVEGIVDDRLQVVKMWSERGLPVFRVGHPELAF